MIDILLIAIIAIIIGANDASNVFGSAVGSKMLKFKISVIFFILKSFIDKKYDLTGIRIFDQMETIIPKLGFVPMIDAETNELVWVDTLSKQIRENYSSNYNLSIKKFETLFNKNGAGVINCKVDESYVKKLLGYFKQRA